MGEGKDAVCHGDSGGAERECLPLVEPRREPKDNPSSVAHAAQSVGPGGGGEGAERGFAGAQRRHPACLPLTPPEVALKVTLTQRCQVQLSLIPTCYRRTSLLLTVSPFPSILEHSQRKPPVCSLTSLHQGTGGEACSGPVCWSLVVQSFVLVCREVGRRPRYPRPHLPERSRSSDVLSTILCEILSEVSFPVSASAPLL